MAKKKVNVAGWRQDVDDKIAELREAQEEASNKVDDIDEAISDIEDAIYDLEMALDEADDLL